MDDFRGLFDKLDKNKDGFISTEELQSEMRRIGVEPVCEKVQVRQYLVLNRDSHKSSFFHMYLDYIIASRLNMILLFRLSCPVMTKMRMDV